MKMRIDRERCVGTGNCVLTTPAYFSHDDDGIVVLLKEIVPEDARAEVGLAVMNCPAMVISLVEEGEE